MNGQTTDTTTGQAIETATVVTMMGLLNERRNDLPLINKDGEISYKKTLLVAIDEQSRRVYIEVSLTGEPTRPRLSMSGYAQRSVNSDYNYCGQIKGVMDGSDGYTVRRYLITNAQRRDMLRIWNAYHLNDMQAACEHQREAEKTWDSDPSNVCPVCGWKLGHAWGYMPIPTEVLNTIMAWETGKL